MAAGTQILHKRKAGAFTGGDLAAGEMGVDTTNGAVYFSKDGTTVTVIGGGSGPTGRVVATKGGSSQSVGASGYGKVTFATEVTDVNGDFASSALTVASSEVWVISGVITVESLNSGALHQVALYKDGSFHSNLNIIGSWGSPEIALPFYAVVDDAGDYDVHFTTSISVSKTINGDAQKTFIKCHQIR